MGSTNDLIRIEVARNEADYSAAVRLIENVIHRWYGCLPPVPPKTIVIAKYGDEIVGTSALEFSDGEPLPIEDIYDFDRKATPWPFERSRIVQFGRWAATMKGISGPLIYASTLVALARGRTHGVSEVKERIAERFLELGVELRFIQSSLLLDRISPERRAYYTTPPPSQPCMVSLGQMERTLEPDTMRLVSKGALDLRIS